MTQAAEEAKSREVLIRLIRTIDHIDKSQSESRISMPSPDCDPDSYFTDIPEGFYDKDLMDIQNMDMKTLDAELAKLDYSEEKISAGVDVAMNPDVLRFPYEKSPVKVDAGQWLQMNILGSIWKEALSKSLLLSKKEAPDASPQKKEPISDLKKDNTVTKLVLAMFACVLVTSVTFAKDPILDVFNSTKDQFLLTIHNVLKPANNEITLNYDQAILLLDRVERGEIEMTTQERINLYEKMYLLAKNDAQTLQKKDSNYSQNNACSTKGVYEHPVRSGDTIAKIINGCGYQINHDMSKFLDTLNINDMVVVFVRNSIVQSIELRKKSGTIPMYNSTH